MKKTQTQAQQEQLRAARKRLSISNAELAAKLGKSEATLLAWLAPVRFDSKGKPVGKHRTMPRSAKLLLGAILAEHRAAKRKS